MDAHGILTLDNKKDESFLRKPARPFSFSKTGLLTFDGKTFTKKETADLIARMRKTMKAANGVGLSANQIGLPYRLFVASVYNQQGNLAFYAVFNPRIEKAGAEAATAEEGCLSIPGTYGKVPRAAHVTISGFDKLGKPLKLKAWGLLARVFQHEIDHLNGKLFIDRTRETYSVVNDAKKRAERREAERRQIGALG